MADGKRGGNNSWENQNYGSQSSNQQLYDQTYKDDFQYMQDVSNSYGGHVGNKYSDILNKVQ